MIALTLLSLAMGGLPASGAFAADPSLFARSTTASVDEQTITPALRESEEGLQSSSTLAGTEVSKEDPGEFSVNTASGPLGLTPLGASKDASANLTLVNETVALFANTYPATDTILRPEALGASSTLQLRSKEAPSSYTWEVRLGASQELRQLPDGSVAIVSSPLEPTEGEGFQPSEQPDSPAEEVEGLPETSIERRELEEEEASFPSGDRGAPPALPTSSATTSSMPSGGTPAGMPEPQNTQARYTEAAAAMAEAESQTMGQALMVFEDPLAVDAHDDAVASYLSVQGNTLTMSLELTPGTSFPVLARLQVAAPTDQASEERAPVRYGLADDRPGTFGLKEGKAMVGALDPNLSKATAPMHVTAARLVIPYDTVTKHVEREEERLVQWVEAVKADHLRPFIALGEEEECRHLQNPTERHECMVPSVSQYESGLEKIYGVLERIEGGVRLWGAWNEPDIKGSSLQRAPGRAAKYWRAAQYFLKRHCGACRAVAGEFSLTANPWAENEPYIKQYLTSLLHASGVCPNCASVTPSILGMHDYRDVTLSGSDKNDRDEYARKFIALTKRWRSPQVVVSEAAPELSNPLGRTSLEKGSKRQREERQIRAATAFLTLRHLVSPRIEQMFYYQYRAPSEAESAVAAAEHRLPFDSGMLEAEPEGRGESKKGAARPAYCYLAFAQHVCTADPRRRSRGGS